MTSLAPLPHGRRLALFVLAGALTLGSAAPQLINGFGGLDWQAVVLWTSALTLLVFLTGLVWGFAVVADSAQFSTIVTEGCELGPALGVVAMLRLRRAPEAARSAGGRR
ncbi:MAG TPA: hypothetical protein VFA46_16005 [Actinomycetes bacterium]|nr:hypothetical protein [Actinomycetes bacterium]